MSSLTTTRSLHDAVGQRLWRIAELVALAVAQAAIGISSDRQFLGLIGRVLPGWFPHLPEQSQHAGSTAAACG
jgi:hypothetical protein